MLGFVLGAILGLTSVGTGALIGVAMIVIFKLTPQRVAGTSVFLGAVLLWVAGLGYAAGANIDFGLMGNLLIGSSPRRVAWIAGHRPGAGAGAASDPGRGAARLSACDGQARPGSNCRPA